MIGAKKIIMNSVLSYYRPDINIAIDDDFQNEIKKILVEDGNFSTYKNFIIDNKRVRDLINFDCFNCYKVNKNGCCNGSPNAFMGKQFKNLDKNLKNIISGRFSDSEIIDMLKYGMFEMILDDNDEEIGGLPLTFLDDENNPKCVFLMTAKNGSKLCSIKNWCYENDYPIEDICHFECLLFPLEVFSLEFNQKEYILLTSLLDGKLEEYSRWGYDDSTNYVCFLNCDREEIQDDIFEKENYKPIYKAFDTLLKTWFGKDLYKFIDGGSKNEKSKK